MSNTNASSSSTNRGAKNNDHGRGNANRGRGFKGHKNNFNQHRKEPTLAIPSLPILRPHNGQNPVESERAFSNFVESIVLRNAKYLVCSL